MIDFEQYIEKKAENDDLRDQLAMRDKFQKQEPCGDVVSLTKEAYSDLCLRASKADDLQRALDMEKGAYNALVKNIQCDDAISRQAVMDCFKKWQPYLATRIWSFEQELSALPSVNPQEPKTGHWIYICNSEVNGLKIVKCSECGKRTYGSGKYCPNCGAKMAESEVENGKKEMQTPEV